MDTAEMAAMTNRYIADHQYPECLPFDTSKKHYSLPLTFHKCLCGWVGWLLPEVTDW